MRKNHSEINPKPNYTKLSTYVVFLRRKLPLKITHLLPTSVETIMKHNHIIVGLGFSCNSRPIDFATLQRAKVGITPYVISIGMVWYTGGDETNYFIVFNTIKAVTYKVNKKWGNLLQNVGLIARPSRLSGASFLG